MTNSLTYADAGVDIDKANRLVETIKKIAQQTRRSGVMGEIGGFGGLFSLNIGKFESPVLVSSTDGVGTKLKIAFMMDKHDTVGIDLVAMCANDVVVQGAEPLFFLDYISMGKLNTKIATEIITGIGEGCRQAKCALIGGETAEMPDFYKENEYDLAGFVVGIVENSKIIDGSEIRVGNQLIGIASSGLHSNGYSLVRKVCFEILKLDIDAYIPELGRTIGEELLTPTKIYSQTVRSIIKDLPVYGLAHITGGGIVDNILRVIPDSCNILLQKQSWDVPPVFDYLQQAGKISDQEMLRTFNNGIGMIAVVPEDGAQEILERLTAMKEKAYVIGEISERKEMGERIQWV
ncbi:MAG: phosphoribosylformylglycinamidine cyclo-ligase [Desulfobacterales bacterium]|uniref:Phosphoribosylformylglycinamidine cyclo-ligase n=1 Tax=Candidatus Desulfatibia profunda TaxID=2841695 RepID=A0A8J6NJG0_9BACT|nr:phosphoribosylformylglycinamidine cyclo-ligase [Candidatus Desulfatibia profunda]MBL7179260.1 phosphoribosylformylglycinamidine cyclo-ligase [Desulfobacterales bacterium]